MVDDQRTELIVAGDLPGSLRIPGDGAVSLAIGGFIKAVAILDSTAEAKGADSLLATLGTRRSDRDGAFPPDAALTRLFLDARARPGDDRIRGYVEADLNSNNDGSLDLKLHHAYGDWQDRHGTVTAGQRWSTLMDPEVVLEGLTEGTVSSITATSGSDLSPETGALEARDNRGAMLAYRHPRRAGLPSTAALGCARPEPLARQPGDAFASSECTARNLRWQPRRFLTLGVEYAYGRLENPDDSALANHRLAFGVRLH